LLRLLLLLYMLLLWLLLLWRLWRLLLLVLLLRCTSVLCWFEVELQARHPSGALHCKHTRLIPRHTAAAGASATAAAAAACSRDGSFGSTSCSRSCFLLLLLLLLSWSYNMHLLLTWRLKRLDQLLQLLFQVLLLLLLLALLHCALLQLPFACRHQRNCPAVEAHHDLPHIIIRHRPAAETVMTVPARPASSCSSSSHAQQWR
jgi:hypothetical protein